MSATLPREAQVVIVGGGVIGCAIACHLARAGVSDVVLLERRQLTCGTTWHAAGLVGQLRGSFNMTRLAKYTAELYASLEADTGQATGYRQCGSVSIATHPERLVELRRNASMAKVFDLRVDMLTREEVAALHPLIDTGDVLGGAYIPSDGYASPIDTTRALAMSAKQHGATLFEDVAVTRLLHDGRQVTGVMTADGDIAARKVVLCAGMWTRELARLAGVSVPLHACEHYYAVFDNVAGMPADLPVLRDYDARTYYKPEAGKLLIGAFEEHARPWGMDGIPEGFFFDELPGSFEHFEPILNQAMERVPALAEAGMQTFFCGPESFTPDVRYHLGEAPELDGCFIAAGLNSIGLQSAGGIGKVMADWVRDGHPPMDLWEVDIRRAPRYQSNPAFLRERVGESLGMLYAMHWPNQQHATGRGVRRSILHDRLAARGACFGAVAGWERADWFGEPGTQPEYGYSWGRQGWFAASAAEHLAVREAAGLFDLSSLAKLLVSGPDALALLDRVSAGRVDVPPGRVIYTPWLNARGGIEADVLILRLAAEAFLVCTQAATAVRDQHWLRRNTPAGLQVQVRDLSSAWAVLALQGPRSREVLQAASSADVSAAGFRFGHCRELDIGYANVLASRFSYCGELGWELFIPTEYAPGVYDTLLAAGEPLGLRHAGMQALNSLRIEKGYCHWGHDISDEDDPLAAGLDWALAMDKPGGFIGREAIVDLRAGPPASRLVQLLVSDPRAVLWHNEPVLRDGAIVGYVRSGAFGHSLGGAVGMAYVACPPDADADWFASGDYAVEIAGECFAATACLGGRYDPDNTRLFS